MYEERIYQLFKKSKDSKDQEDIFLLTAVSDLIRLFVEELMKESKEKIKDNDALHYVFIVPSEWEEEVREVCIRPIFVQANLISEDDHQDRLLFCSDIESVYYALTDPNGNYRLTIRRNAVLGRIVATGDEQVLIKLYVISVGKPLFNFFGSVAFPKIMTSNSLSITSDDVKNSIRELMKTRFSFDAEDSTIRDIMGCLDCNAFNNMVSNII